MRGLKHLLCEERLELLSLVETEKKSYQYLQILKGECQVDMARLFLVTGQGVRAQTGTQEVQSEHEKEFLL